MLDKLVFVVTGAYSVVSRTPQSIWRKLDLYPPVLVRLLAKHRDGTAMSDADICNATQGQLSLADVKRLSYLTYWHDTQVGVMMFFTIACGVDFGSRTDMRSVNRYVNNDPKFTHLRSHRDWPQFKEMLRVYAGYLKTRISNA